MNKSLVELPEAMAAWGTPTFATVLKSELERLAPAALPLQEGVSHGSYLSTSPFEVMVITIAEAGSCIRVGVGIHYRSVIAGCSCADDPTPMDELAEYCQVELEIDKASGRAQVTLQDG